MSRFIFHNSKIWLLLIQKVYLSLTVLVQYFLNEKQCPPQVDAASSNLNSNDAFILVTPGGSFLWVGEGASDPEKQGAQQLCDILGVSASELPEGGETGEETQ